jgi:multidrug resistance efflux pump
MAVAILAFVPAPLKIEAPGELRPAEIFNAFAPRDGYISDVFTDHDDKVLPGKQLLQLESPDLELELRRTEGAIESTRMELRAAEAARRRGNQSASASRDDPGGFAADETRLQAVLESYLAQRELLRDEQRALKVVSPLDGYVLTWQPRQNLIGRPVQRGQRLMQIAATDSRWTLVLELPDQDAGHVIAARTDLKSDLPVTYNLATEPRKRLSGAIAEMSAVTEVSEKGAPIVEVVVSIDRADLETPRAGAQVRATIHCGDRPLGYVLFYRLWDSIHAFLA